MDGGSFRTPQPERRVVNRSEPASRPPEPVQQPIPEESRPVAHRPVSSRQAPSKDKKSKKPLSPAAIIGIIVLVVVLGFSGWFAWTATRSSGVAIDSGKYQAVSFADGQLYFGKLSVVNDDYLRLTNVYYLQPQSGDAEDVQDATSDQSNFKLIKFTDVIYGPEDEITIAKSQVLFYENLNPDGKVAQLIDQYNKQ